MATRQILFSCGLIVANATAIVAADAPRSPLAPSDTSSPRATFESFLVACDDVHRILKSTGRADWENPGFVAAAERVLDCLDLTRIPPELQETTGLEAAVFIKEVLDRVELPASEQFPRGDPDADMDDARLRPWSVPGTRLVLTWTEGDLRPGWRFSAGTVRRAAAFFKTARQLEYRTEGRPVTRGFHDLHVAATRRTPQQTADTASPRGTLILFLGVMNELHASVQRGEFTDRNDSRFEPLVQQALSCLDSSELPEYSREYHAREAAICLKEVLDRTPLPAFESVPGVESLVGESGEVLNSWQVPSTQIVVHRVQEGPRKGAYLFSPETVRGAAEFFARVRDLPYRTDGPPATPGYYEWWFSTPGHPATATIVNNLPDLFRRRLLGLLLWQWSGLLLLVPVGICLMYLAYSCVRRDRGMSRSLWRYWLTLLLPITAMLVPLGIKTIAFDYLTIRGTPLYVTTFLADLVLLVSLAIVLGGICNRLAETLIAAAHTRGQGMDAQLIRIIGRLTGLVAGAVVFLEGGRYLGFPLTTLLASAGIGGLAVALAGQSLLKGLFGTLTIMLDKPFREGERIVVKGHDGFVEEIGLRSTKIRTFMTNHLIAIPNDQIAEGDIENIGRREHIQRMTNLHIPIDTDRAKVERAVAIIREVLTDREELDREYPPRVFFDEFNADSFNIMLAYWFRPANLWQFKAFSEKVNLEIFRRFEAEQIQFSLPVRHSYWRRDEQQGPLDVRILSSAPAPTEDEELRDGQRGHESTEFSAGSDRSQPEV